MSLENEQLRLEIAQLQRQRKILQNHRRQQERLEESLRDEANKAIRDQEERLLEYQSMLTTKQRIFEYLETSKGWNVLNDCFYIGYQGSFATINGLRIGDEEANGPEVSEPKLNAPTKGRYLSFGTVQQDTQARHNKVPWVEMNAAFGQVALLLSILEERLGITFRHKLLPMGSTSKIGKDRNYYNLFSDDNFQFFGRRNFNTALQCLMECIIEAFECVHRVDRTIAIPYPMTRQGDNNSILVGGLSIAYTATPEWTRACKYWMTNLKHLLLFRGLWV